MLTAWKKVKTNGKEICSCQKMRVGDVEGREERLLRGRCKVLGDG